MTGQDSFWNNPLVGFSPSNDFDFVTLEAQFYDLNEEPLLPNANQINTLSPIMNESTKREHELVSEKLSEAKGKSRKKQRRGRAFSTCESSASQQQPEPKTEEELLKELIDGKSVSHLCKIFMDRIRRRTQKIKLDNGAFEEAYIREFHPQTMDSFDLIKKQWPGRSDLEGIEQKIKEIENDNKQAAATDESKLKLFEVGKALQNLDEQQRKVAKKPMNLEAIFTRKEELRKDTARKELFLSFSWFGTVETATEELTADQGCLRTLEHLQATFSSREMELYAMDNNIVGYSDFQGLEEALKNTPWGVTPDYLKPIASRIEKAGGKAIEDPRIQVLVCAAIQEMEDLPVENLNWDMVKKWGATLNMAKERGFHVEFADNLLKKNFYAFYLAKSFETKLKGSKIGVG